MLPAQTPPLRPREKYSTIHITVDLATLRSSIESENSISPLRRVAMLSLS